MGENAVIKGPAEELLKKLELELKRVPQDLSLRHHIERLKEAWGLRRRLAA